MTENSLQTQALKLKGRLYTFTVLQVHALDTASFTSQLRESISQAPKMFEHAPVVLDFSRIHQEFDLQEWLQLVREHGLIPVAVQGVNALMETLAQCQGLAVFNSSSAQDKPLVEDREPVAPGNHVNSCKYVSQPVRSGQQVVARHADLVVTASVSHGAELLADGNIHVYGALRGRALAGMSGNLDARIFCQSLEADLVSIAGFYALSDALGEHSGPCQIYLQDEQIRVEAL